MRNGPIALHDLRVGDFVLLCDDPLLEEGLALFLFCEPVRVASIHRGDRPDDRSLLLRDCMIVQATEWDRCSRCTIAIEVVGEGGGRVLIRFPDDRHVVEGINLPNTLGE